MNILYVNGYPDTESFHYAIQQEYVSAIDQSHQIRTLELARMSFDPVLRGGYRERMSEDQEIIASQNDVRWADHIVFAYPVWWGGPPSLLSGWVSRVFTPGDTYQTNGLLHRQAFLKGKTADIIVTSRVPRIAWSIFGNQGGIVWLTHNLFALTGIKKRRILILGSMRLHRDTDERRSHFMVRVHKMARSI